MMDIVKIRSLSDEDLKTEQAKAGEQMFRIRFQKSLGNQEGLKALRSLKLDVARLHTITRERAISAEREAHPIQKSQAPAPSRRTERKKAKKA